MSISRTRSAGRALLLWAGLVAAAGCGTDAEGEAAGGPDAENTTGGADATRPSPEPDAAEPPPPPPDPDAAEPPPPPPDPDAAEPPPPPPDPDAAEPPPPPPDPDAAEPPPPPPDPDAAEPPPPPPDPDAAEPPPPPPDPDAAEPPPPPPDPDAAEPPPPPPDPDAALPPPAEAPALPAEMAARIIDDADWPDPAVHPDPDPDPDPGPEPATSPYGTLPAGWDVGARSRWTPENTPKSILTLGDSISESQAFIAEARWDPESGVSLVEGYVHLPKELGSMAGQESRWGAEIVGDALAAGRPETATILFGTNDARHGYELPAYTANMRTLIEACLAAGTLPVVLTPPPLDGGIDRVSELAAVLLDLALEYQVPLFDLQRFLVDRGQLAVDLPDGVHPSYDAYMAINAEWIRFYKHLEWHALTPMRPAPPPEDPYAADNTLVWERVFDRSFSAAESLDDLEIERGAWSRVPDASGTAVVLSGRSGPEDFAILRLPVRVDAPTPVRMEITATSDGAEISMILQNAGDPWGTDGWYFGWGTNGGLRTGIVFQDGLVAELPNVRPEAGLWSSVAVARTPNLARWGTDGTYRLSLPAGDYPLDPGHDRVGFYVWGGTVYIHRVVVWAGRAP
jgi:lysophospholipase L1-like esterase